MSLACQKDSYLRELTAFVLSCEAAQVKIVVNGKKQTFKGFHVVLSDTVLFPEGGGQPDDRGTIDGIDVLQVQRDGAKVLHLLPTPLDPGSEVKVKVQWDRRWDHMQQHSGQHLVTAIADAEYSFPTTSWNLGEKTSFIEIDTVSISDEQIANIERITNEKIMAGINMFPTLYENVQDPSLKSVRTRGLPDDHVGAVRVVTIEGIETNMCCGTHVRSLSHLQALKILSSEKRKGKVILTFIAGERVMTYVARSYDRDRQLTALLKGGPEQHLELVEKLQKSFKTASKSATSLLREAAILEGRVYQLSPHPDPFFSIHKKEGDNEFMNSLAREVLPSATLAFITVGDDTGLFMLSGEQALVASLGPQVAALLGGKGAGKNGRFQGKATKMGNRAPAEELIRQHMASSQ
ncbi:hypothetical protein CAPTEDRAFT_173422 [Capitella teleta]|uniref:Threonyl/alanyl tRNA synthetase SAD domain-containing protein n=1 Tax=Capitella teleta TaxID=283909 RepID=R7TJZ0_CAPTE|nr:hypothetical protein CAPTEDRAFT_173422 [Capitella teleta]|eukprot:ELT94039.1 hypothetical protein CAPTEDRAFT_173422 [Capitella teleta]